jgi:raffinose/stachyose/melibiose transport system substrate-binding protein
MSIRKWISAAALLTGAMQPAGVAQAGDVTFWTWRQEDRTQYQQLFQDFNKVHPDVRVKFEAFENQNYATILSTALAAGKGPDVIHLRPYGGLEQFSKAGYLLALDPATTPELANFAPEALASTSMRSDGKVYAVPFASQTLGLYINNTVFRQHNLRPPTTWDELHQVAKALKDKGVIPLANGLATAFMVEVMTSVFAPAFYGPELTPDIVAGRATFEDPRYTGALAKLLDLKDYFPTGFAGIDYPTMQQLFLSGRAGMFAGGSFEIANFRRQKADIDMDFIAPPAAKAGDKRLVSLFFDGGYAVNAKAENQADALKLVRYMATKPFGDRFAALLGNISPIRGVKIEDPLLQKVADLNQSSVPYMMLVYFRYQEPTGSTLLQGGIQKMFAGTLTPQQLGAEITKGVATYYEPFKKR